MATSDFGAPAGVNGSIAAAPSLEVTGPIEADPYTFNFNSLEEDTNSFSARSYNRASFEFKDGSGMAAVMRRITSVVGGSVFLYAGHGTGDDGDLSDGDTFCYKLGLQDGVNPHVVLCKGPLNEGIPQGDPGSTSGSTIILGKSSEAFSATQWVHLRLVTSVQASGDVIIEPQISSNGSYLSPVFGPIPGMSDQVVDGTTQITTGSAPLVEGKPGFGMHSYIQNFHCALTYQEISAQPASP